MIKYATEIFWWRGRIGRKKQFRYLALLKHYCLPRIFFYLSSTFKSSPSSRFGHGLASPTMPFPTAAACGNCSSSEFSIPFYVDYFTVNSIYVYIFF
jgi:hypothetical protein